MKNIIVGDSMEKTNFQNRKAQKPSQHPLNVRKIVAFAVLNTTVECRPGADWQTKIYKKGNSQN